jgi:ribosome-associated protein
MPIDTPRAPDDAADTPSATRPSKTRLKQDSHDLQALGEALLALPRDRIEALPLSESLRDAIAEMQRTRSHEGRRRQMQYIGKLMRGIDPEPIRHAVAELQLGRAQDSLALHEAEHRRAELIASDEAVTRWIAEHPQTDVPHLRNLVRNARKDAALSPEQRSGRAYRELFQYIRRESSDG